MGQAFDYGSGTVSTTALALSSLTGLDADAVSRADRLRLTVNTNSIRYRYDGAADPTTSEGHHVATNGELILEGRQNIQRLKIIRNGASDATVSVTLERF